MAAAHMSMGALCSSCPPPVAEFKPPALVVLKGHHWYFHHQTYGQSEVIGWTYLCKYRAH